MKIDFKVVDNKCKEFSLVTKVFNERIAKLYGPQEDALNKIGEGRDRLCEMLFINDKPEGIIIYKKDLQNNGSALELKTLCLIDSEKKSGNGFGTILLNRVHDVAERRNADKIAVTVSSKSSASLGFFRHKDFRIDKRLPDLYIKGDTENVLTCPVSKRNQLTNTTVIDSAVNASRSPVLFRAPRTNSIPDLNCTLKQQYLKAILSGKKTFEGRVATRNFELYTPGKTVKWNSSQESVTTEIVSREKFSSFAEMLSKHGYEKFVPEARSLKDAIALYDSIPRYTENARRFGVIALELRVVTPSNEQRPVSFNERNRNERQDYSYSGNHRELGRKRSYSNNFDYNENDSKRRRM